MSKNCQDANHCGSEVMPYLLNKTLKFTQIHCFKSLQECRCYPTLDGYVAASAVTDTQNEYCNYSYTAYLRDRFDNRYY